MSWQKLKSTNLNVGKLSNGLEFFLFTTKLMNEKKLHPLHRLSDIGIQYWWMVSS